jgi:hypothetical protein
MGWYTRVQDDGKRVVWHQSDYSGSTKVPNMRALRALKRYEATERAAQTVHERTKAHRLGRCAGLDCPSAAWDGEEMSVIPPWGPDRVVS